MATLSNEYLAASDRIAARRPLRQIVHDHVMAGTVRYLDMERIPRRVDRLLQNPVIEKMMEERGVADELRSTAEVDQLSPRAQSELESVLGGSDFMPVWFLTRGAELRRTVARVRARTSTGRELNGTGFLIGPRLLLTNFHVLDWTDIGGPSLSQIAPHTLVEFDYEEQFDGLRQPIATFRLEPETLLMSSTWHQLDYVLVALEPKSREAGLSVEAFGYNRLAGDLGKITTGESVFIIQHANGQPKQVVVQNNRLIDIDDNRQFPYLTYEADTDHGSSGSPVFNRQWEVVGLHHSTEFARDDAGRILAKDGSVWQPAMGPANIRYLDLNEGIRISRIVEDLVAKCGQLEGQVGTVSASGDRCSSQGLVLLKDALRTHFGAPPAALIQPVPIENPGNAGPQAVGSRPAAPRPARRPMMENGFPRHD